MIASVLKSWDKYSHDLRREKKKKKTFNWNNQAKVVSWPKLQFFLFLGLQSIFTFGILKKVFTKTLSGDADTFKLRKVRQGKGEWTTQGQKTISLGPRVLALGLIISPWQYVLALTSPACPRPFPMSPCVLLNQFTDSVWNLHPPQTFYCLNYLKIIFDETYV